jgi:hypothetical protein
MSIKLKQKIVMKKINRNQAEELFQDFDVTNSLISQDKHELQVVFTFTNKEKCIFRYSLLDHNKTYFIISESPAVQNHSDN